jgi:hypothetical protein
MKRSTPITEIETRALANRFFAVVNRGGSRAELQKFFLYPDARLHGPNGRAYAFDEYLQTHAKWSHEQHVLSDWATVPLSSTPPRARIVGNLYWEARYRKGGGRIRTVVTEEWIVERVADGSLRIVLYHARLLHPLPDSAKVDFE